MSKVSRLALGTNPSGDFIMVLEFVDSSAAYHSLAKIRGCSVAVLVGSSEKAVAPQYHRLDAWRFDPAAGDELPLEFEILRRKKYAEEQHRREGHLEDAPSVSIPPLRWEDPTALA